MRLGIGLAWLALLARVAMADEGDHVYKAGDRVVLWVNKVGPYNNPQETYNYFSLPYCSPQDKSSLKHKWGGLGEVLQGNELIDSGIHVAFAVDVPRTDLCSVTLSDAQAFAFSMAIQRHYWFELFMDELPIWGFVGEMSHARKATKSDLVLDSSNDNDDNQKFAAVGKGWEGARTRHARKDKDDHRHHARQLAADATTLVYTHKAFEIGYNGANIVAVNLTNESPVAVSPGSKVQFSYSVKWIASTTPFEKRFVRYLDEHFFEHQIHWFSVLNSFLMVLFLVGLVFLILMRTLRQDYARYAAFQTDLELLDRDLSEESGWKLVHGDVFRTPPHLALLCSLVGTGAQLTVLILLVILVTIFGVLYEDRGSILTAFIVCYALTSFIGGYVSGALFKRHDGKGWVKTLVMTATLYPWVTFGIAFVLNTVAIMYGSLAAVPFGSMVVLVLLWTLLAFPMCMMGTIVGKNMTHVAHYPCRVKRIPSPIPDKPWYLRPFALCLLGGLLPFGSIFIEMYFIFTSFWNYKVYYVYGFMLLVFCMLTIVTLCATIVATYFLLNAENYHWPWTSFCASASTAVYVFFYGLHYFLHKTKMTGFFQTAFYFGYTLMFCLGLGTMCGAIGYLGASIFVRRIYSVVKVE